ncbi:hypothetical protein [Neolewinella antarctica]|uniref:Uncharacterized protein (DUF983 family) n=1 Tax=Neolewinella antarctica TaxID=442734 RepID=A0ABX0XCH9_9BACT|nr:hypothetical protein [Neolewinella antarctica]NJC26638.1 uncharacterized protein (DUF983 family) [Neolewinella antarctica]
MTTKHYTCPACHEENRYKTFVTDRVELERAQGEAIRVTCKHCHESRTIHPNDVFAKPSLLPPVIVAIVVAIPLIILFRLGWIVFSVALIGAPFAVWAAQQQAATRFNGYRIRERQ